MRHPDDILTSQRLSLRRITPQDLELLLRLHGDPRVMRYAGGVLDRASTETLLSERILRYYGENPGLGIWATIERATGACVGLHLLNHIRGESFIQVGYLLFPEYWGRGYATEMAVRVLQYGYAELGLPKIVAVTDLENADSQRVLRKAGMHRSGERTLAHPAYGGKPLAWFERDAESWLAERRTPTQATS